MRGIAVGGPLHGQIISSSRAVEVLDQGLLGQGLNVNSIVGKSLYRPERLGVAGSPQYVTFWVHDSHSKEAAQAMAWEMLLGDFEDRLHRSTRREHVFG